MEQQPMQIKEIDASVLLDEITKIKYEKYRLIQICATKVGEDQYEVLYTFGKDHEVTNVRITISGEEHISSITSIFDVAYLYENEIHDLFGIQIDMINVDFKGKLYRTGVPTPFK